MKRYELEIGSSTSPFATSLHYYNNANDLRKHIEQLNPDDWYVVSYVRTRQIIVCHNWLQNGTRYDDLIYCPKALQNL